MPDTARKEKFMGKFDQFFLMNTDAVKEYTVEVLHYFEPDEELSCTEIGDGNINYVSRVQSLKDGRSVIVKQADKLLRSSGRPLDLYRNKIEAQILELQGQLAPEYVPQVFRYDETMAAISMEDISAYGNLRKELAAGHVYGHLAENLSTFMVETLLATTDLVMERNEKKRRVQFYTNPELCNITEDLVLTEPYDNFKGRNIITSGNEAYVEQNLYQNEALKGEVAKLRYQFMNHAQSLLHGDLHSGSVFANEQGLKVIDPEFAFYGPMGYDIGNVVGNLYFSWANKVFAHTEDASAQAVADTIVSVFDLTFSKMAKRYDELVTFPLYRTEGFKKAFLDSVMADTLGYAGTEIIRRTVGDSKVMEITSVENLEQRIPMERALIQMGIHLIMHRNEIRQGKELAEFFQNLITC